MAKTQSIGVLTDENAYKVLKKYSGITVTFKTASTAFFTKPTTSSDSLFVTSKRITVTVIDTEIVHLLNGNDVIFGKVKIKKTAGITDKDVTGWVPLGTLKGDGSDDVNMNCFIAKTLNTEKLKKIDKKYYQTTVLINSPSIQYYSMHSPDYLLYTNGKINASTVITTESLKKAAEKMESSSTSSSTTEVTVPVDTTTGAAIPVTEDIQSTFEYTAYEANPEDWISSDDVITYKASIGKINIDNLRGIFGMPYQYLPTTDPRIDGSENEEVFGTTYADKIASRLPLLYITPGNPAFLGTHTQGDNTENKSKFQEYLASFTAVLSGADASGLSNLLDGYSGKLYSIEPAYAEYFNYVNPMCRIGAVYLGLDTKTSDSDTDTNYKSLDGVPCQRYNWAFNDNGDYDGDYSGNEEGGSDNDGFAELAGNISEFQSFIYYRAAIPFYINSDSQFTDTMNNETSESSLASKVNGFSDSARELQFVLGTSNAVVASNFDQLGQTLTDSKQALDDFVSKISGGGGLFSSIVGNLKTIVTGGRLQFPNIWSNSTFSKSYGINVRLTTPDLDVKSWWVNIYVPLCHLIALVMPRGEFHNGYSAPFIIKAFYKGMFNVDMGIITDMTINKGKEGGWTKDGLPTVVDVQFTIQDLYSTLSMSSATNGMKANVLQNIAEMDYLANLCGVNINVPDTVRMVEMYVTLNIENRFIDIPFNIVTSLENRITNRINALFASF